MTYSNGTAEKIHNMHALKKHFSRIVIISLSDRPDRREKLLANLTECGLAEEGDITWFDAVDGRKETIPDWWTGGPGAWGCRFSQLRVIEQAQRDNLDNVLIIEDDSIFHPRTAEWLDETLPLLPSDWGQFFLGGQHLRRPEKTENSKLERANYVTRTHAYAVNYSAYQIIIDMIKDDEEYRSHPPMHVDHQFGRCQLKGLWKAYSPSWWMAGQEEGESNIAFTEFGRRWWQEGTHYWKLPFVLADEEILDHAQDRIYTKKSPAPTDTGELATWLRRTAHDAWLQGKLPTWKKYEISTQTIERLWPAGVKTCNNTQELTELADYPANGLFSHPFFTA